MTTRSLLLGVAAAAGLLLTSVAPAAANEVGADIGTSGAGPSDGIISGSAYGEAGGCGFIASSSYWGGVCGGGVGRALTPKEVLGKDPVPTCWHEALTPDEVAAMQTARERPRKQLFWEYCLTGIDPKTKKYTGPVRISVSLVNLLPEKAKRLTGRQRQLVDLTGAHSTVPVPVAVTSPSSTPRVGAWTSFFNYGVKPGEAGSQDHLTVSFGSVTLDGRVVRTTVQPLGEGGGDVVQCPGAGRQAQPGDTPETAPGCWYRYPMSSAGESEVNDQGLPAYPVLVTATWEVDVTVDGVTRPFNSFNKSSVSLVPVSEIQTLVVN